MKIKIMVVGVLAVLVSMSTAVFGQKKADYKPKANDVSAELALTGVPMRMTPDQLPNQFSTQLRNDVKNSKGTAVLKLNGNDIEYTFTWTNLTSPVTQAHFHFGPQDHVGARALSICGVKGESPDCPGGTSNTIAGVWKNANVDAVKDGDVVIAFHTAKYPAPIGEIAVYIPAAKKMAKANDVSAELALTGVPMRMTPDQLPNQFSTQLRNDVKNSKGTAVLKLNGNDIEYTFTWTNLTSPVTQAHFHFGPQDHVGARALSICGVKGESPDCPGGTSNTISGVWKNANVDAVKDGDVVIAFHTAKYPAPIGEIAVYIPASKSIAKATSHAHNK